MNRKYKSSPLIIRPTFLEGMGRIFDFAGALNTYDVSSSTQEADGRALASDWRTIGDDIRSAMSAFERDLKNLR